jgi:hypothetical protein
MCMSAMSSPEVTKKANTISPSAITAAGSEPFGPQQRVDQLEPAGTRERWRQANNRRSWQFSSEPFADVTIADRQREKAEAKGQHDDIKHERSFVFVQERRASPGRQIEIDQYADRTAILTLPLSDSLRLVLIAYVF